MEPLVELRKIKTLYKTFGLKNDEWETFKVKKLKLEDWEKDVNHMYLLFSYNMQDIRKFHNYSLSYTF